MDQLPDLPAGFTPKLLTDLLHEDGVLPADAAVVSLKREQVGDGTGMMAEISKLVLTYEGNAGEAPATVIAKYSSQNETNREIANQYNLPERETRYIAELDRLTEARTPRAYCSLLQGNKFLILMEDMTDYEVGSQVKGADLRQSELAIDELAKLHSAFWEKVDDLDWVPHIANSYHADNMKNLADIGFDAVLEKFADFVPASFRDFKQDYLSAIRNLQAYMDSAPVTLVHGDYRMENLLYGCKPGHDPVAIIDWQGPLIARGMNDVALFLAQSTKTEVRREHERALLQRYLDGLAAGGVKGLSFDALWESYRHAVLYSWVYVSVVAGTLDSSNATAFAWMSQMVARQAAAMLDLDVLSLLPGYLP